MFILFFSERGTTELYTLSLHDALPICSNGATRGGRRVRCRGPAVRRGRGAARCAPTSSRSEEHTSELQSPVHLVCRLLLEKKKTSGNRNPLNPWRQPTRGRKTSRNIPK